MSCRKIFGRRLSIGFVRGLSAGCKSGGASGGRSFLCRILPCCTWDEFVRRIT